MSDFDSFLQSENKTPPAIIHERLKLIVQNDLHPGKSRVALKVSIIHILASLISLAVCPQFGVGPLGGETGVMAFLMTWGWTACAVGCGMIFMIGTGALSALLLNPDEKRTMGPFQGWVFSSLAVLSWAALMLMMPEHSAHSMADPESIATYSAIWNFVWISAAAGSSLIAFRVLRNTRPLLYSGTVHSGSAD